MKKTIILVCLIILAAFSTNATIYTLDLQSGTLTAGASDSAPLRTVEQTELGFNVTYTFTKAVLDIPDNGGPVTWHVDGFGEPYEEGKPAVLSRSDSFIIPPGKRCTVSQSSACNYRSFNYTLADAVPPVTDGGEVIEWESEESQGEVSEPSGITPGIFPNYYPSYNAKKMDNTIYRGVNIAHVDISPIQYSANLGQIRACTSLTYIVRFMDDSSSTSTASNYYDRISNRDSYIANIGLWTESPSTYPASTSSPDVASTDATSTPTINFKIPKYFTEGYLILTKPKFSAAVEKLRDWKAKLGYTVFIDSRDSWDQTTIKEAIQSEYDDRGNLYYVLLVGDYEDLPAEDFSFKADKKYEYVSDFYYSCMDGVSDIESDLYLGRIPVKTLAEADTVITKIINYEKNPPTDASFYKNVTLAAYFQDRELNHQYNANRERLAGKDGIEDRIFARTAENIHDYLVSNSPAGGPYNVPRLYYAEPDVNPQFWGGYAKEEEIPSYLKKPNFRWSATGTDVKNSINNGSFLALYRGHGTISGWYDIGFTGSYVSSLTNGNKLPFVLSLTCYSGTFNDKNSDCFAETLLKNNNGGAIGVIAATCASWSLLNDWMAIGMINAIWSGSGIRDNFHNRNNSSIQYQHNPRTAGILKEGLASLEELYPPGDINAKYALQEKQLYHLFGDPSLRVYNQKPKTFNNIDVVAESYNSFTNLFNVRVTVNDNADDVVIFCNDHSMYAQAHRSKSALFYIRDLSNLEIVVSGHNYLPWSQPASVLQTIIQGQEKFAKASESIIDENKVWMYGSERLGSLESDYFRFNGIKEIDGNVYHKLYHNYKILELPYPYSQSDIIQLVQEINVIPEFDFDNLEPCNYIRQEGEKYYMLWAKDYNSKDPHVSYMLPYGSNLVETLIYDFSVEEGGRYFMVDATAQPKNWYLGDQTECAGYDFRTFNEVEVIGYESIDSNGNTFTLQINEHPNTDELCDFRWSAIKSIGGTKSLENPAMKRYLWTDDRFTDYGLINVRTLAGEYIYGEPYISKVNNPSGVDDMAAEEAEAEYFSMDGRKVAGSPAPGVYIERRDNSVRKVIIK